MTGPEARALAQAARDLAELSRTFSHIGRLVDPVDEAAVAEAETRGETAARINREQAEFCDRLADELGA